jgi:NhaP-type Na+/H+ or K+/H+ antiporter
VTFEAWILLIGGLLLLMGLGAAYVRRLPLTGTMVYLAIGLLLGPAVWGVLHTNPSADSWLFHRAAEITVIVSLFTVGLKLRLPLVDKRWVPSLVLAFGSMTLTVGLITAIGFYLLQLPLGAAVLLGGVLAPTDPVLASDVQVTHAGDRDKVRLALSGEAGFNDGTAFPFVMLGLGLLGLHELGAGGWRWWIVDVSWAIAGGLGIGSILGYFVGHLILHLRRKERDVAALDEYLLLGLIGVSYGVAVKLHAYGFLAVFAAGVAVRALERRTSGVTSAEAALEVKPGAHDQNLARHPELAPVHMAGTFLAFNEQLERILEVGMVLLVGAALASIDFSPAVLWFIPLLLLVVRPISVLPVWWTRQFTRKQFAGVAWFGVRGIGSIYYVMYAVDQGLPDEIGRPLVALTFMVVAASIVVHGISTMPLLGWLQRRKGR